MEGDIAALICLVLVKEFTGIRLAVGSVSNTIFLAAMDAKTQFSELSLKYLTIAEIQLNLTIPNRKSLNLLRCFSFLRPQHIAKFNFNSIIFLGAWVGLLPPYPIRGTIWCAKKSTSRGINNHH